MALHPSAMAELSPAELDTAGHVVDTTFASRYMVEHVPTRRFPEAGAPMDVVYQMVKDLRSLDARPNLNLASFVTTWMEPRARDLIMESLDVNFVDAAEYPSSNEIASRCVSMLAGLYHAPTVDAEGGGDAVGAPCIGSSEAIMLGALAMKKRWAARRKEKGLDASRPNLVMGAEIHVVWEKFCRYWDVEPRYVVAEEGRYVATPELLAARCDENTIGVAAVLGTTFTGEFQDVEGIDAAVGALNKEHGWGITIHVDAASGGFIAPFIYPHVLFDFRLPNVASINVSGHKYGLVYPGIGWVLWRSEDYLPESMVFYCSYLGTTERNITLNFSRPASQIVAQYYQFHRLGRQGYHKIMTNLTAIAKRVRLAVQASDHFELLSKEVGVPLVAFRLRPVVGADGWTQDRLYDEFQVAERMRINGWIMPAYTMPKGAEHIKALRITIREDLSMSMCDMLMADLHSAIEYLDTHFCLTKQQLEGLRVPAPTQQRAKHAATALPPGKLDAGHTESRVVKPC